MDHNMDTFRGFSLDTMQALCTSDSLPISNNYNHTVMFELPLSTRLPKPHRGKSPWDKDHVKMPFSSNSLYAQMEGVTCLKPRWELIQTALLQRIKTSEDLQEVILTYNSKYRSKWNFSALHILFNEVLEEEESKYFFDNTLPSIIQLALQLPSFLAAGLPLLRQNRNHSISLSQQQISSLLANAFLCTFPHRNTQRKQSEYGSFPTINFNRLYEAGSMANPQVMEKLKCICHYFRRVCTKAPTHVVTFTRQHISSNGFPDWSQCTEKIGDSRIHITSKGTIEDDGVNMLQVDFANKYIGGGVLGWGCVQEEIRFVICPELIVSRLFTEALNANEAIIITGCERYSMYSGYSQSFTWTGDYKDNTPCDQSGRLKTTLVAIDAIQFTNSKQQFIPKLMERELNKAFVGFRSPYGNTVKALQPVATGNWGCGAFGGEATLKALIQLMAARYVGRDFVYFTFGDLTLCEKLYKMICYLRNNNITIGELWSYLCAFHKSETPADCLYPFLMQIHIDKKNNSVNSSTSTSTSPVKSIEMQNKKLLPGYNPFSVTSRAQMKNIQMPSTSRSRPTTPKKNSLTEAEIDQCISNDVITNHKSNLTKEMDKVSPELRKESLLDSLTALEGNVVKDDIEISDSCSDSDNDMKNTDNNDKVVHNVTVNYINETNVRTNVSEQVNNNKVHVSKKQERAQRKISDFFTSSNKK